LFFTVQLVALPLKLRPSASVDSMTVFSTVQLLLPYCSQKADVRVLDPQPVDREARCRATRRSAFAVLSSCLPTVLPRIAKPLRLTGPGTAEVFVDETRLVLICEYQSPAPDDRRRVDLERPSLTDVRTGPGIHTDCPAELAAETALRNAWVESAAARRVGAFAGHRE